MHCPWTGCANADAQFTGKLRVTAGHKSSTLFVTNQDESDLVLAPTDRVQNMRDLVSRKPENHGHSPLHELLRQKIGGRLTSFCGRIVK